MSKRKRHKRLFPRRYASDFINTYQGIDQSKVAAYDLLNNRQRVANTKGRRDQVEPVLNNTFMQDIPERRKLRAYDDEKKVWIDNPRSDAVEKKHLELRKEQLHKERKALITSLYATWQSKNMQKVVEYSCQILEQIGRYNLCLYFAGTEFILVLETEDTRMISRTYRSREEAMGKKADNKISWIIVEEK